jgi:hypothetical protein
MSPNPTHESSLSSFGLGMNLLVVHGSCALTRGKSVVAASSAAASIVETARGRRTWHGCVASSGRGG